MREYCLDELFDLQMGKTPSRNNFAYWNNGSNDWISIGDLSGFEKYVGETKEQLTDLAVSESGIKPIPVDTVVMSFKLSIGKLAITTEEIYSNEAIMAFIDKEVEKISPDYLYYLLLNKDWNEGTNKAVMGKTLNKATLSKVKIKLHEFSEQEEIVLVLDKANKLIKLRKQQLEDLDNLIKSRFVEMFGDPRINPYGYDKKMLKETCKVVTGNTPSRAVAEYYGNYMEWIKTDNIVSGVLNPTTAAEYLSEKGVDVGRTVDENSILMACIAGSIASIGRVCITNRKVAFNQQINAVIPESYNIYFIYVMLQISKDYLVEEINMALKGILSKSKLEDKIFFVPPIELQNQFASFVQKVDKLKVEVQKSLSETQILFDTLMQDYFEKSN